MQNIPSLILLSALLPYLTYSLRVEYLVVPALVGVALLTARRLHADLLWATSGLMFALLAVALSSYFSWETGLMSDPLSSFARLVMPALMLLAFPTILSRVNEPLLVTARAVQWLAIAAVIGLLVSLLSTTAGAYLLLWVRSDDDSVWAAARDIGRYTGIFNQPLEAGLFYSVALLALVYDWKAGGKRWFHIVAFGAIMAGGGFSFSKNFLVVGLGSAAILALALRLMTVSRTALLGLPFAVGGGAVIYAYNENYVTSLVDLYQDDGLLSALSAGRYGNFESEASRLFRETWDSSDRWTGHGLGAHLPLDNGYLEYFYPGGLLALGGYICFIGGMLYYGFSRRNSDAGRLILVLMVLVLMTSLGGPVITASRANVALMLLLSAAVAHFRLQGHATLLDVSPLPIAMAAAVPPQESTAAGGGGQWKT